MINSERIFHQLLPHLAEYYQLNNQVLLLNCQPYVISTIPHGGHINVEVLLNGKLFYFESVQRVYLEKLWRLNNEN